MGSRTCNWSIFPPYVSFLYPDLRHSAPLPSSGILGEVGFVMSYFIVVVLFREKYRFV